MMTSRQRLLGTMSGTPIDRVPISTYELVGWNDTSWENQEPSYRRLMEMIRAHTDCIYMAFVNWRPNVSPNTKRRHWQEGNSRYSETVWITPRGSLRTIKRTDQGVYTTWTLEHPLKDIDDIDKYLSIPWEPAEVDMSDFYAAQERLGSRGVMMLSLSDPICQAATLFGMERFLIYAFTEQRRLVALMDLLHERQMAEVKKLLSHDVKGVQFRICGPEYATPPYLGREHFRLFVFRYLRPMCTAIREAGGFARLHCHGKVKTVLDQIVAAGAEGLDPIEPPPDGDIELGQVKKAYGQQLCLFGNLELRDLEHSDPDRIEGLVRTAMDQAKEGGGYVLMPTAAPINVPLAPRTEQNYLRFIEGKRRALRLLRLAIIYTSFPR